MSSIDDQLASLKAAKLPRLRQIILNSTDDDAVRGMFGIAIGNLPRDEQQSILIQVLEAQGDEHNTTPCDGDEVQIELAILRGPLLHEHRLTILHAHKSTEIHSLLTAAMTVALVDFPRSALQDILDVTQPIPAEHIEGIPATPPQTKPNMVVQTQEKKRLLTGMEWDQDKPPISQVQNSGCRKSSRLEAAIALTAAIKMTHTEAFPARLRPGSDETTKDMPRTEHDLSGDRAVSYFQNMYHKAV
jgi:hypothetical protein